MAEDPLSLIEYWSIDPDYDDTTFRSTWQDYRENTSNDSDALHCVYNTRLQVPHKEHRRVCVKAVDVFGFGARSSSLYNIRRYENDKRKQCFIGIVAETQRRG